MVLLRVDMRPGHLVFVLSFPLFPNWEETPMLKLIASYGKLWIAPGPPPEDVSPDGLMAHLATEENRGLAIEFPEQTLAGLRILLEKANDDE